MTYMVANFVVRDGLHNVGSANTFSIVAPKQEIILMILTGFFSCSQQNMTKFIL